MIVFTQDPMLLKWAGDVLRVEYRPDQCAWISSVSDSGEIRAVVVFSRFSPYNCEMSLATNGKRNWFSRNFAKACYGYAFNQMGLLRITGVVEEGNEAGMVVNKKLGHVEEARLKAWFGDKDGIVFRMLKDECKWLT